MFEWPEVIRLLDTGSRMEAPHGMVYATGPKKCLGHDGRRYVVKNSDSRLVLAEAVAYALAGELELPVPPHAVAIHPDGGRMFASLMMEAAIRDVSPFVAQHRDEIAEVVVLDVWLCNIDRNLGGLLIDKANGEETVFAIDFERSVAIRSQHPTIEMGGVEPAKLWPREDLGRLMKGAAFPTAFVSRTKRLAEGNVRSAIDGACNVLGVEGATVIADALLSRRERLDDLVRKGWAHAR